MMPYTAFRQMMRGSISCLAPVASHGSTTESPAEQVAPTHRSLLQVKAQLEAVWP